MGPQIEMSSLVLTIQLLGYLIFTHTPMVDSKYNLIDGDSMVDSDYSIRLISS